MHGNRPEDVSSHARISERRRRVYSLLGWLCFALGFLGMVVPLMPTTVFWICATWLWLRSAPQRVRFLVEHPRFGASIRGFLERGEMCRTGKTAAIGSMAISWSIWYGLTAPRPVTALVVAALLGVLALWLGTRPEGVKPPVPVRVSLDLNRLSRAPAGSKPSGPPPS